MAASRRTILYVEDDPRAAFSLEAALVAQGYAVTCAATGEAALASIAAARPGLVLSNIDLPGLSGFALLEQLSSLVGRRRPPFLFLTSRDDRASRLQGHRLGADGYVTKPVDFEMLCAIVEARFSAVTEDDLPSNPAILNQREIEMLSWASRGMISAEIAEMLKMSKRTVDFHIDNARTKLGAKTRIEAVVKAAAYRMIGP